MSSNAIVLIATFRLTGYILCLIIMHRSLNHMHVAWRAIFFFCIFVSLVPQQVQPTICLTRSLSKFSFSVIKKVLYQFPFIQLLEFRYFIIPYIIFRIHLISPSFHSTLIEWWVYLTIDILSLGVYMYKPFKWEGTHETQRFMW